MAGVGHLGSLGKNCFCVMIPDRKKTDRFFDLKTGNAASRVLHPGPREAGTALVFSQSESRVKNRDAKEESGFLRFGMSRSKTKGGWSVLLLSSGGTSIYAPLQG